MTTLFCMGAFAKMDSLVWHKGNRQVTIELDDEDNSSGIVRIIIIDEHMGREECELSGDDLLDKLIESLTWLKGDV